MQGSRSPSSALLLPLPHLYLWFTACLYGSGLVLVYGLVQLRSRQHGQTGGRRQGCCATPQRYRRAAGRRA